MRMDALGTVKGIESEADKACGTGATELDAACWSFEAFFIAQMLDVMREAGEGERGVLHVSNRTGDADVPSGITWYDFARAIVEDASLEAIVKPARTGDLPRPARRPAWSVLDVRQAERAFGEPFPAWRDSLRSALPSLVADGQPASAA